MGAEPRVLFLSHVDTSVKGFQGIKARHGDNVLFSVVCTGGLSETMVLNMAVTSRTGCPLPEAACWGGLSPSRTQTSHRSHLVEANLKASFLISADGNLRSQGVKPVFQPGVCSGANGFSRMKGSVSQVTSAAFGSVGSVSGWAIQFPLVISV